ncbi:hypothetical protein M422DRAFT_222930 [Sphaerobolus stellatus SS14]|nr:hypothetical protein M422DRAFT_222930 [Sphaerobolus stellatus SS14]
MTTSISETDITKAVDKAFSAKAKAGAPSSYANNVAKAFGYTAEQLESIPAEANLGLSCGNPVGTASIKEGEVVLDLGSGGGIDILLAAEKVGLNGRAIGLDGSPDMIVLARKNAARKNLKPPHVAFAQAFLTEKLPIVSSSIDCILSNCVINLLPEAGKASLLKEAYRVLRGGGRIVLDDIIAKKELPSEIRNDLSSYVNCVSGAIQLDEYKALLDEAGFKDVMFVDAKSDLNIYYQSTDSEAGKSSCCGGSRSASTVLPTKPNFDANEWVASYQIYATKSGEPEERILDVLENWWYAYPVAKSSVPGATVEEVEALIRDPTKSVGSDYAIIDVRRNDHAGGHVSGSDQWHAQTFPNELDEFFAKYKDTKQVFFHCQSSNGRGPRCAAWYQDYLNQLEVPHNSKAYILTGGIKEWKAKYQGESDLIDYD